LRIGLELIYPLRLSSLRGPSPFFKGKFIEIVPEQTDAAAQPQTAEQKPVQQPGSEQKSQNSEKLEPGYFPLNPRGPIY
jgi:hypothetical protein